jgi:hypothetical protein
MEKSAEEKMVAVLEMMPACRASHISDPALRVILSKYPRRAKAP